MTCTITKPSHSLISLSEGQSLVVEPKGMLAFKNCSIKTKFWAENFWNCLKVYWLGGETLLRNTFTALPGGGWIALEEHMPGQIVSQKLNPAEPALIIRRSALLATTPNVKLKTRFLGFSGYLKGQGFTAIRAHVEKGEGNVLFHVDHGTVQSFKVNKEQGPLIVDNQDIIAYSENLETSLKRIGKKTKIILFSGEGLVCEFKGDGIVYASSGIQTGTDNLLSLALKTTVAKINQFAFFTFAGFLIWTAASYTYHHSDAFPELTSAIHQEWTIIKPRLLRTIREYLTSEYPPIQSLLCDDFKITSFCTANEEDTEYRNFS